MDYLGAAEQTAAWLQHTARRDASGWWWPYAAEEPNEPSPGLGWGVPGPMLFFVEMGKTTGDRSWLEPAGHGLGWMEANLEEYIAEQFGCGLLSGVGGWALVAQLVAEVDDHDRARGVARRVLEAVAREATITDDGVHWRGVTEILWGTAGIGCLLLAIGAEHLGDQALDLATGAGRWLVSQAEDAAVGLRWSVGDVGRPALVDIRFPNFAHGSAGIAFFLSRLSEVTGDAKFHDGALRATEWILSTTRTDDDTCAAYHHEPDATDLYTLGWCHGPPGLGWLFRQLEITTGDTEWRTWLRRAANADRTSGIPERLHPGFWDNVGRCCGSASVAEFFLDLHTLEARDDDLAFAITMIDDIIDRATVDDTGMRWSNIEHRADNPVLPASTSYLQGASGIGSTLLRLHRHLNGDPWVVPWPHAPLWSPAAVNEAAR